MRGGTTDGGSDRIGSSVCRVWYPRFTCSMRPRRSASVVPRWPHHTWYTERALNAEGAKASWDRAMRSLAAPKRSGHASQARKTIVHKEFDWAALARHLSLADLHAWVHAWEGFDEKPSRQDGPVRGGSVRLAGKVVWLSRRLHRQLGCARPFWIFAGVVGPLPARALAPLRSPVPGCAGARDQERQHRLLEGTRTDAARAARKCDAALFVVVLQPSAGVRLSFVALGADVEIDRGSLKSVNKMPRLAQEG